jgi:hypothetical protein
MAQGQVSPNFSQSEAALPVHFQNSVKVRLLYVSETNSEPMKHSLLVMPPADA